MDDATFLKELAATLSAPGMPSQTALAKAVGVDQPLISRALSGSLRRVTPRVRRLSDYATMRAGQLNETANELEHSRSKIDLSCLASKNALRALDECRAYLADGCDAMALRDQIAFLRRLQQPKTMATPRGHGASKSAGG